MIASSDRRVRVVLLAAVLLGAVVTWWAPWTDDDPIVEMSELARTATSVTSEADFPAIVDSSIGTDERIAPTAGSYQIVGTIAHDPNAFTQGLEFDGSSLFESTGLRGLSTLRELDPASGEVLRRIDLPADVFGEGLTIVDDVAIQLTWTSGVAYRWDVETFELLGTFTYDGEGWGLCEADGELLMSNGTSELTTRSPSDFSVIDTVQVTFNGAPVERLNELECVDGSVWANIWQTPLVIEIDPDSGRVLTVIDAGGLRPPSTVGDDGAVLNGIAYDAATDTFLLSGKLWPTTYRVRVDRG